MNYQKKDIVIVSGAAIGVDAIAHKAAGAKKYNSSSCEWFRY